MLHVAKVSVDCFDRTEALQQTSLKSTFGEDAKTQCQGKLPYFLKEDGHYMDVQQLVKLSRSTFRIMLNEWFRCQRF